MTTESWKLEKDLCRCCLAEGSFINLSDPRTVQGQQEIYSTMLKDSLDINIMKVSGDLCVLTYSICQICVSRLRDASNFKKQVLRSEERFRHLYNSNIIQVSKPTPEVKEEVQEIFSDDCKDDYLNGDDDYLKFEDEEQEKIETSLEVTEDKKKSKSKPKPKSKTKKSSKKIGRPRKIKEESAEGEGEGEADADGEEQGEPETKRRKGEDLCTVIEDDSGGRQYSCNTCAKLFKTLPLVRQHHAFMHLRVRPSLRACLFCEVKVSAYSRAFHLERAHGMPAPTCNACGKKFAYPYLVTQHQKTDHMEEKDYVCPTCNLRFATGAKMRYHAIKHSTEKKFKCDHCEKGFKYRRDLRRHVMIHLGIKEFVCKICKEAFVQQTSLKYHLSRKHPEIL